jgi:hypothetical protein
MSTEILKTEFVGDQHPDDNQLLLALERELPSGEIAEVERHIGLCWDCRTRYYEMHRGILIFAEYRDKLFLQSIESAPHAFRQFPSLLEKTAAEGLGAGLLDRIRTRLRVFFSFAWVPVQAKWVAATAAIMMAVLLWTQVFDPTTLSAGELLTKAAQSQSPPAQHREVRQKVRVKTAKAEIVREFHWRTGGPIPNAKWGADPENWTAALTAEGFAQWHESLSGPKDNVKKSAGRWTMKTTVAAGPIKEASIVIRDGDFHPTEQHILFSDDRTLDLEELSFEIVDQVPASVTTAAPAIPPPPESPVAPQSQEGTVPPRINLDEAELELRYTMFTQHWDYDEDLQIARTADEVIVSGTASSAELARQMQATLVGPPGVRLSISMPGSAPSGSAPATAKGTPSDSPIPLLKDRLDVAFASVEVRRDFIDRCLAASDSALSHAWALKRLVERYTDADRRTLKPESQIKLDEMLRGHLRQLAVSNSTLDGLLDLLAPSRPPREVTPDGWRPGVLALVDLVQQQDSLVAALVAGTQSNYSAATASERFLAAHEAVTRLARELLNRPGDGNAPK